MTQAIIPGCEANPDPTTVINVDPTKPMKEINMNETKSNAMDNADIPESFKAFLATGSSVIQTCRDLVHVTEIQKDEILRLREENERLRNEIATLKLEGEMRNDIMEVLTSHNIGDADKLDSILSEPTTTPADYQTLKDFKGEMDAIHDEFDIQKDVSALRDVLSDWKEMRDACDNHGIEYADLDSTLEEKDQFDNVLGDHDITDASDLEDTLTDMEDAKAYEKGFNELAEFVEKIKEVIGHHGDDIPATDMEDYK